MYSRAVMYSLNPHSATLALTLTLRLHCPVLKVRIVILVYNYFVMFTTLIRTPTLNILHVSYTELTNPGPNQGNKLCLTLNLPTQGRGTS